jgi:hypothetical protein
MGFAERYSTMIAQRGIVPTPSLLLEYQGRLGLASSEVVYALHVLRHLRDDGRWPWLSVRDVGEMMGVSDRQVQRTKADLRAKGYLRCTPRSDPERGRLADEHDLTLLLAELERLALQEDSDARLSECRYLPLLGLSTWGDGSVRGRGDADVTGGATDVSPGPVTSASPVQEVSDKKSREEDQRRRAGAAGVDFSPAYLAEMERRRRAG